jgi:hypothetical protein
MSTSSQFHRQTRRPDGTSQTGVGDVEAQPRPVDVAVPHPALPLQRHPSPRSVPPTPSAPALPLQ